MVRAGCVFVPSIQSHLWCVLGKFLFPVFKVICPKHECQDLLSPRDGIHMYAQTGPPFILSPERVQGNGVRTHVNSKQKIPSTRQHCAGSNLQCCIMQDSKPNTLPTELFWTPPPPPRPQKTALMLRIAILFIVINRTLAKQYLK